VEYDSSFLVKVLVPPCTFLLYKNVSAYFMISILVSQHAESHKTNFMTSFLPSPLATSLSLVTAIYCRCAGRADKGKETFLDLPARYRKTTSYMNCTGLISFIDYCLDECKWVSGLQVRASLYIQMNQPNNCSNFSGLLLVV